MAATVTVNVDTSRFNAQVQEYYRLNLKGTQDVLKTQARLFLAQALKFTPPKTKPQGANAIRQDLFGGRKLNKGGDKSLGVFFVMYHETQHQLDYQVKSFSSKDVIKLWTTKDKKVIGVEKHLYRPHASIAEMYAVHQRSRSRATGRVSTAGSLDHTRGRWSFIDRMVVGKDSADRYLKHIVKRVGLMKAGWVPAILRLGGSVPKWVQDHAGNAPGKYNEHFTDPNHIGLEIINHAAGARKMEHFIRQAMEVRISSMKKDIDSLLGRTKRVYEPGGNRKN